MHSYTSSAHTKYTGYRGYTQAARANIQRRARTQNSSPYSAEREESTFLIFSVFSSYLHHTIGYGQRQHMTVILNLY